MTEERAESRDSQRVFRRFQTGVEFTPWTTWGVLAVLLAMHVLTGLWDVGHNRASWLGFFIGEHSKATLVTWGARTRWAVQRGQAWRLLGYGLLHANWLHLGMNGLALLGLGRITESVFGGRRLLLLLLTTTLAGGVLSWWGGGTLSVGISGGVFGLMGALVAYGLWYRAALPAALRELFGRRLAPWVALNLALGIPLAGVVDNYAHVGGLISGLILGPTLADHILDNRRPSASMDRVVLAVDVGLLLWVVVGLIVR